ncbi:50S ribosomal protein L4 [Candidatus Woesearchaeota archaeon]|nr:50S ribosomal protein L4 [Nanoarchaeota archaeon]MCB9370322.1 50S ribosomal protein L4 [Candidatus Woesearchaeota archaeon]USN44844.1 MAG: 50S ribosomal protein L4 [Candidatus Woesearchaeota archaeon]
MKLTILDKTGTKVGDFDLELHEDIREDIFKKAYLAENSLFKQEQGADPEAGKKAAIHLSKRRRKFRTTYGRGGSRTPKKVMWARGRQLRFVGAFAPNTVGGRKAHPPKAEKKIYGNINNKEWERALRVGLAACFDKELVSKNGQKVPENYPLVLDDSLEALSKTKEVEEALVKLGFEEEVARTKVRKVRAGHGTMRGRTYKDKRGPLVVVSKEEAPLIKAVKNVKGFEVLTPELLMVSDFGMSEKPGRALLFTKSALAEFKEVLSQ